MSEPKQIYFKNRAEWRVWLEKNHAKEKAITVIKYKKHTGKPSLTSQEAMHEAICFGWIDTTVRRLDEDKYVQNFAKRSAKSKWSDNTFKYAKQLIKEGKMAPAGLAAYKDGLTRPTHHHGIPDDPTVPNDLKLALSKNKKAKQGFDALAPSYRKTYLRWMYGAKLPETRKKRIDLIIKRSSEGKKFGIK